MIGRLIIIALVLVLAGIVCAGVAFGGNKPTKAGQFHEWMTFIMLACALALAFIAGHLSA